MSEVNCALARVWDWLCKHIAHTPASFDRKWEQWKGVIEREWKRTRWDWTGPDRSHTYVFHFGKCVTGEK